MTHHSTAHIPVIRLWTKDVDIFLHFHAFLQAESGMGSLLNPELTSLKNPIDPPAVKITEFNSMATRRCFQCPPPLDDLEALKTHARWWTFQLNDTCCSSPLETDTHAVKMNLLTYHTIAIHPS